MAFEVLIMPIEWFFPLGVVALLVLIAWVTRNPSNK